MGGKAKPTKHTAAELKAKAFAATVNRGGGKDGHLDRKGGKAGHAKFKCTVCAMQAPDMKTMQIHWESKHPKMPWDESKIENTHELTGGVTVAGVAVQGSKNPKKGK